MAQNYTPRQIELMRRGLRGYRKLHGLNGGYLSWRVVGLRIDKLRSEARVQGLTSDPLGEIDPERVRRFALNISRPDDVDRLNDIRRLLTASGLMKESDFKDQPDFRTEALQVAGHLRSTGERAAARVEELAARFESEEDHLGTITELELFKLPDVPWFEVDVHERRVLRAGVIFLDGSPPLNVPLRSFDRRGYGFISTNENLLCVFLTGINALDRVQLVEVAALSGINEGELCLMRVGDKKDAPYDEDPAKRILKRCKIAVFRPVTAERAARDRDGRAS